MAYMPMLDRETPTNWRKMRKFMKRQTSKARRRIKGLTSESFLKGEDVPKRMTKGWAS